MSSEQIDSEFQQRIAEALPEQCAKCPYVERRIESHTGLAPGQKELLLKYLARIAQEHCNGLYRDEGIFQGSCNLYRKLHPQTSSKSSIIWGTLPAFEYDDVDVSSDLL